MKSFKHFDAYSVEEVNELLTQYNGKAKVIAGGSDLLSTMKDGSIPEYPQALINLKTIVDLDYIKEDEKGISIGALTKLSEVVNSQAVKKAYAILGEAARSVATPGIRNMATIGGNIAQDVRCWYYRYPNQIGGAIICLRKGGKVCDALAGDNRYHSIFGAAPLKEYPCSGHCPAKTDIPSYLSKVKDGNYEEAADILLDFNPISAITGRVCPIFCEPNCNRKDVDEPVAIRCVERSVGDYTLENAERFFSAPRTESGKTAAVVGSGPAGLATAFYLRRLGHAVTVYERLSEAGGMLMHAIPAYRLPKDVVKKQIQALSGMGIIFKTGINVDKDMITDFAVRFDAVLVAGGAWKERTMGIKGEAFAISGLGFLKKINGGDRSLPGKKVAVVGGGNVALDVARTLHRLGAQPVILYRRTQKEMPALKEEVERALAEGITFKFLTLPAEVAQSDKNLAVTCVGMKLGDPDASGRCSASPVSGSEKVLFFDAIIKAIGEEPDTSLLPSDMSGKLFTGGDFVTGPSTVIEAVAAGKESARRIQKSLKLPWDEEKGEGPSFMNPSSQMTPRVRAPELSVTERVKTIDTEDALGISAQGIEQEAGRCYNCGCLAVNPSDIAIVLIALKATVVTNKRTISAEEFFTANATESTVLGADEIIAEIKIPRPADGTSQHYIKYTLRKPVDFSVVSATSVITVKDDVCTDARIVLGAVSSIPLRAVKAEEFLIGKCVSEETATEAAQIALTGALPLSQNGYKVKIARTLVKRTLLGQTSE
ncbi:FAD binding domain-containing protein [Desulfosporosinus burensis]